MNSLFSTFLYTLLLLFERCFSNNGVCIMDYDDFDDVDEGDYWDEDDSDFDY